MTSSSGTPAGPLQKTEVAWERFSAGADSVRGVRPDILMSWYRCRQEYQVDPHLSRAPVATEVSAHSIDSDVVFAELGGAAVSAAREVDGLDGLVTVADPEGRILASWGSCAMLRKAANSNLAPYSSWSEWASGTNGMGTALECRGPVMVRGPEHWCQGFHSWTCAGIAVRDAVTHSPLAVLNVSCPHASLPRAVLPWLREAAAAAEVKLQRRAREDGALLAAAFADAQPAATPLAAVDLAGHVVLANDEAAVMLGTPAATPAYAPARRPTPQLPALPQLIRCATERAGQDRCWQGATRIFVPFLGALVALTVRPVFSGHQMIGVLLAFGSPEERAADDTFAAPAPPRAHPPRVVAWRDDRWILLAPSEIRFAEADHGNVWLVSEQGRLKAATGGIDVLEQQLAGQGFLRIHRRFLVNLSRVREIEHGFKGTLFVATDARPHEGLPVARRHAAQLRQAFGL